MAIMILFLATGVFDKGGISRYSRYQIQVLRDLLGEKRVVVFSLLGPDANSFEESFAVHYHSNGTSWYNKLAFTQAVVQNCILHKPDVIWCAHLHLLPLGLILRWLMPRSKVLVNVYGLELWSGRQWLHRKTLPLADLTISDCHFSAGFAIDHYSVAPERVRVLWDCVDTRRFSPRPRRLDLLRSFGIPVGDRYRYILTLGRMDVGSRHKGYDRLIDTMGTLQDHHEFIAIFAGDGNDRPRLEQRVREAGLSKRAFFLGSVPETLLVDVYNLCDLFVLVSDRGYGRGEGIPLTPLEAAACGKPIIVGNEDGSQEAVIDGVNGRVISPRDPGALREALIEILTDDKLREGMGQAARARIEAEFSYESFREKTAWILHELGIKQERGGDT